MELSGQLHTPATILGEEYKSVSKSFWPESITKYMLTTINTH